MRSVLKVRGIEKLSAENLQAFVACCDSLGIDPDWLACVVAFETGGSWSPGQRNKWAEQDAEKRGVPYSGAVGLIQFMPDTAARLLGMPVEPPWKAAATLAFEGMSFATQLEYVKRYMATYAPRIKSLDDCYLSVFYPAAIGRVDSYELGRRGAPGFLGRVYEQNAGFDGRGGDAKDGVVTRGEVCSTIRAVRDAAAGARVDVPGTEPSQFPKAAPLLDMTELAREADDEARKT